MNQTYKTTRNDPQKKVLQTEGVQFITAPKAPINVLLPSVFASEKPLAKQSNLQARSGSERADSVLAASVIAPSATTSSITPTTFSLLKNRLKRASWYPSARRGADPSVGDIGIECYHFTPKFAAFTLPNGALLKPHPQHLKRANAYYGSTLSNQVPPTPVPAQQAQQARINQQQQQMTASDCVHQQQMAPFFTKDMR